MEDLIPNEAVQVRPSSVRVLLDLAFDATTTIESAEASMRKFVKDSRASGEIAPDDGTYLLGQLKLIHDANSVAMSIASEEGLDYDEMYRAIHGEDPETEEEEENEPAVARSTMPAPPPPTFEAERAASSMGTLQVVPADRFELACEAMLETQTMFRTALRLMHEQRRFVDESLEPLRGMLVRMNELTRITFAAVVVPETEEALSDLATAFHGVPHVANEGSAS